MEISRIRLLRQDVAVWLIYAGVGRRFLDTFKKSESVFLTIPGFNASSKVFDSDDLMRRHLAMSDQISRWISGGLSNPPSRNPSNYQPYPYAGGTPEAKSFSAELGNIQRLFTQVKVGDLVLSPPYGHYEPFLIGEVSNRWRKDDDLKLDLLHGETVPVRKVKWLNTALARRDFPPRVSRRLQNKHAITQVDADFYEDIFNLVYPHYEWSGQSKLDVFGDDYTGTDPLQTYPSALLVKYVLASVFAFTNDEFDAFQSLPPLAAIDTYYDESLVSEFGQNFNSPGKFSIIGAVAGMSVLAAAGLYVATADPNAPFAATKAEASDAVKGAMAGPGKTEQSQDLDAYINSMEAVNWKQVQRDLGKPAKDKMELSLNNKVEVATHRAKLDGR